MTTRGEILTKKYIEFKDTIDDEEVKTIFPNLDDYDIADVVMFLEYFNDPNDIQGTVEHLLELSGRSESKDKVLKVLPIIEAFIKFYHQIKKL